LLLSVVFLLTFRTPERFRYPSVHTFSSLDPAVIFGQKATEDGPGNSSYAHPLEDDATFRRWYENAERGSVTYAPFCFRRIGSIGREYGIKLADLVAKNSKEVTSFLLDMVSMLEARGTLGRCSSPISRR
jgi:hypothetical protein